MPTSEWTETGLRVRVELANGMIVLTCQSQAVTGQGEAVGRTVWQLVQLGIPGATPRSEAERLVVHWLAFYRDDALSQRGLATFREAFAAIPESAAPSRAGGQGNMN
jgi:hypothetical protein